MYVIPITYLKTKKQICYGFIFRFLCTVTVNYPKYPVFPCNKTRYYAYIHKVKEMLF